MNRTTPRRLAIALGLAAGLALAPTAAGAAGGYATPAVPPPPPTGPGSFAVERPLLTVELDDAAELDLDMPGRVRLSAPLTQALHVPLQVLFPDADPEDVSCPVVEFGVPCSYHLDVDIPAGATVAPFEIELVDDGIAEDAEVLRVALTSPHPAGLVRLGPPADALVYDGAGLVLGFVDTAPEALEGDPGSDGTLDLVVEANQAVPHPVSVRVHTGVVGFGAEPGVDYQPVDVVAELAPGQTTVTVEVPLIGDLIDESPYEVFIAWVGQPSHGTIGLSASTAVPRILDDDAPVRPWTPPGGYQSPSRSARSAALTA